MLHLRRPNAAAKVTLQHTSYARIPVVHTPKAIHRRMPKTHRP